MDGPASPGGTRPRTPPRPRTGDVAASVPVRKTASVDAGTSRRGLDGDARRPSSGSLASLASMESSDSGGLGGLDASGDTRTTAMSEITLMTYSDERAEVSLSSGFPGGRGYPRRIPDGNL